ncbi:toll/interleukin-1 receptor domain-containing protein [Actinoplanes hulinensis]|uniref:Toll/interleukin-1 receptor domain-containing protein n=1 Tax=Actinoplanes hulinensis TaxID=1144547 RepID=A0ABS7B8Y3_9ACTN|nr:toll/interleukin-1 receptor domain-containing protein [Actinoplanes hulinensis]MBW6436718.1 toll/interleukin-1 receptor domain-containing protein [Actinoplanes hulinensis]
MPVLVSHAVADEPWAQWIALELRAAGHDVHLDPAGPGFVRRLAGGLGGTTPVLLLISAEHRATAADWATLLRAPAIVGRLIVLRLDAAELPRALRALPCRSLHGLDEEDALELLLNLAGGIRRHQFPRAAGW